MGSARAAPVVDLRPCSLGPLPGPPNDLAVQRPGSERKRGPGPLQRLVGQRSDTDRESPVTAIGSQIAFPKPGVPRVAYHMS
jgi:hypothetical protein